MRLIDADELKKELETSKYIMPSDLNRLLNSEINRCIEAIDNAPTVNIQSTIKRDVWELYERYRPHLAVKVYEFGDELKELLNRYGIDERPQGEWIFGSTLGHGWMKCSNCCVSQSGQTLCWSFCPNCGAEMKRKPRDCEHCKHYVERDGSQGCEVWKCEFEKRSDL